MLDRLTPYLGTYRTTVSEPGEGVCPTGVATRFHEELTLERVDDWIRYRQHAVDLATGKVLHDEAGAIRAAPGGGFEVALAMNSGRLEHGRVTWEDAGPPTLRTDSVDFYHDRLGVLGTRRWFRFAADRCDKELWLAATAWPELRRHMWAHLHRIGQASPSQ
ncbi:MAG: heme-binding beta-barrel domain-containing protein [Planctomycetota bacterium]